MATVILVPDIVTSHDWSGWETDTGSTTDADIVAALTAKNDTSYITTQSNDFATAGEYPSMSFTLPSFVGEPDYTKPMILRFRSRKSKSGKAVIITQILRNAVDATTVYWHQVVDTGLAFTTEVENNWVQLNTDNVIDFHDLELRIWAGQSGNGGKPFGHIAWVEFEFETIATAPIVVTPGTGALSISGNNATIFHPEPVAVDATLGTLGFTPLKTVIVPAPPPGHAQAIYFNGIDQYIQLAEDEAMNIGASDDFFIYLIVEGKDFLSSYNLLTQSILHTDSDFKCQLDAPDPLDWYSPAGTNLPTPIRFAKYHFNREHEIAISRTSGQWWQYSRVDGLSGAVQANSGPSPNTEVIGITNWRIGADKVGGNPFHGKIKKILIIKNHGDPSVLDNRDIIFDKLYGNGDPNDVFSPGAMVNFEFSEGIGTTLTDTDHGATATLVNYPTNGWDTEPVLGPNFELKIVGHWADVWADNTQTVAATCATLSITPRTGHRVVPEPNGYINFFSGNEYIQLPPNDKLIIPISSPFVMAVGFMIAERPPNGGFFHVVSSSPGYAGSVYNFKIYSQSVSLMLPATQTPGSTQSGGVALELNKEYFYLAERTPPIYGNYCSDNYWILDTSGNIIHKYAPAPANRDAHPTGNNWVLGAKYDLSGDYFNGRITNFFHCTCQTTIITDAIASSLAQGADPAEYF